ncbi:MAG TPA: serine--tRNA ligase [Bacteroidales bacterium]|nr:serine--tRNA ligase [Bacteroidales bacterium]
MLELQTIRDYATLVAERLAVKNVYATNLIDQILLTDKERRETKSQLDQTLAEANNLSKMIGLLFREGKNDQVDELKVRSSQLKINAKEFTERLALIEEQLEEALLQLPNIPHKSVKPGKSADDNEILFTAGNFPNLPPEASPHWELCQQYQIIDFDLGTKITGAGFPVYRGAGARLQRALINFFLNEAIAAGYIEYQPPLLVNEASAYGTGQLPDKDKQMYFIGEDRYYLIPTAEVPVTNFYRDAILNVKELPVKNVAYTACFRREAGSYGKDVRGLNRLHQFDKVEIVQIEHPSRSYETLEQMLEYVCGLLKKLELPFRVVKLCGGDLSFTSALTYDLEVYSGAQQRWLEVSSISNFESFQANRMKLRFRDEDGKTRLAHTLNGSALALPRIVAALLENNQRIEGIAVPETLIPYMGSAWITKP